MHVPSSSWRIAAGGVALVVLVGGGATASSRFDARNAHKVDGRHAVGPLARPDLRAGKLVATDGRGRLPAWAMAKAPDAGAVGGAPAQDLWWMSIPPQSAYTSGAAHMSALGPVLPAGADGSLSVGFVEPPSIEEVLDQEHLGRLKMRVTYLADDTEACSWTFSTGGQYGPEDAQVDPPAGPSDPSGVHDGRWALHGGVTSGPLSVAAGESRVQRAVFAWDLLVKSESFVQFALARNGTDAGDTCGDVTVVGLELLW